MSLYCKPSDSKVAGTLRVGCQKPVDVGSIHVARFCSVPVAADVSPEGASVRPAKGEALVQRPHHNPFLFPVTSGPTGQQFIFTPTRTVRQSSRDGQSGKLLARWAEHRKTRQNITRGATDIPGLRPSLDERLGLRPG